MAAEPVAATELAEVCGHHPLALRIAAAARPDVILLDVEMPRKDGYELATQVRADARLSDIPIVMITSRTGEKHRARAIEIGVNDYLGKPYQENQLLDAIDAVPDYSADVRSAMRGYVNTINSLDLLRVIVTGDTIGAIVEKYCWLKSAISTCHRSLPVFASRQCR